MPQNRSLHVTHFPLDGQLCGYVDLTQDSSHYEESNSGYKERRSEDDHGTEFDQDRQGEVYDPCETVCHRGIDYPNHIRKPEVERVKLTYELSHPLCI